MDKFQGKQLHYPLDRDLSAESTHLLNNWDLVLFTLCFVAPEQKLFYGQFLLPDSVERVLEPRGLISLKFSHPGLVFTIYSGLGQATI